VYLITGGRDGGSPAVSQWLGVCQLAGTHCEALEGCAEGRVRLGDRLVSGAWSSLSRGTR
jgi:DNA-binding transcriptional regulator YdaS (Cro superfamily)